MIRVELHRKEAGRRFAVLRPLRGSDEIAFDETEDFAGSALIDALLAPAAGASVGPGEADRLTVSDRDRLLAALYRHCFGDRIESVCRCRSCGERFEISFLVSEVETMPRTSGPAAIEGPDADGYYRANGARFRLPTIGDLKAVAGLGRREAETALRARCVAAADGCEAEDVDEAMETAGPVLSCELDAACPQCGAAETVPFDLERYLLSALASERRFLTREIHVLASAYHWPLADIMSLSREDRRALVRCVDSSRRGSG